MVCRNCGAKLPDGSGFCVKCGAAQTQSADGCRPDQKDGFYRPDEENGNSSASSGSDGWDTGSATKESIEGWDIGGSSDATEGGWSSYEDGADGKETYAGESGIRIRKSTLRYILIGAAALLAVLIISSLAKGSGGRVNLMDYLEFTYSGYNGNGTADYTVTDLQELTKKLTGKKTVEEAETLLVKSLLDSGSVISPKSGLSNGDTVELRLNNLTDFQQRFSAKISDNMTKTGKVTGLGELETYNILDDIIVNFTGSDSGGSAEVTLNEESSIVQELNMSVAEYGREIELLVNDSCVGEIGISGNGRLSNGEEVTLQMNWIEELLEDVRDTYGVDLSEAESKTVTVSGLTEPEEISMMDHVEFSVTGIDGKARAVCTWKQETWQAGEVTFAPDTAITSGTELRASYIDTSFTNNNGYEDSVGIRIDIDPDYGLSEGDTVTVTIEVDYMEDGSELLTPYGIIMTDLTKDFVVEKGTLDRYVTDASQLTTDMILQQNDTFAEFTEQNVKNDWGRCVHGNSYYISYDQTITSGPVMERAYLVCTDSGSNTYALYVVMYLTAKDSELSLDQPVYVMYRYDSPAITPEGELLAPDDLNSYYRRVASSMAEMEEEFEYTDSESTTIYELR